MSEDYWDLDAPCKKCGHAPTRRKDCPALDCEDGEIDEHEDDPINYPPGSFQDCNECNGTGFVDWCPKCGADQ